MLHIVLLSFIQIGYEGGISMQISFAILAGFTFFFFINTFILLPKRHIPWPLPPDWGTKEKYKTQDADNIAVTEKPERARDEEAKEREFDETNAVEGIVVHTRTVWMCIKGKDTLTIQENML